MQWSLTVRSSPLKSSCFSWEKNDHCWMPGAIVFMRLPHSEEMVLWTSLVTFFRMPASSGRSRMSSSLTVKNLRCPDLVREIRNMPRLGVTGMTISTDGSMLLTSCTNFSFPSANSSIRLYLRSERASALARGQQLLHFGLDHLGRADLHRSHPLPADYPLRSEEHTSELQSLAYLVCRLLL